MSRAVPYPPTARRSPLRRSMPYPPTPLPPAIPNWGPRGHMSICETDECGCDECGASGAAATHRHGHAGLYVGAGCHVTLQVQGLIVHRVHWTAVVLLLVVGTRGTEKTVGRAGTSEAADPHTLPPRKHSPRGRLDPYPPTYSRVQHHTLATGQKSGTLLSSPQRGINTRLMCVLYVLSLTQHQ